MDRGGTGSKGVLAVAMLAAAIGLLAAFPAGAAAKQKTVWLCRPGLANNPCTPGMRTTHLTNDGQTEKVDKPKIDKHPKIDCFYVYPTVSDDKSDNSDLSVDPEERSIALYQAARYSQECRVFAPMYKQVTLARLAQGGDTVTPAMRKIAYQSALSGWKAYLKKYNDGRPFVLIGHSQGSTVLRQLIAEQIDSNPALRRQLVSAILLGGDVLVKKGKASGGDFQHIPGCASQTDVGCVVAWATYNEPPPSDSLFGRTTEKGMEVLCDYPGLKHLQTIQPTAPFAPGTTFGALLGLIGFPTTTASTPWEEYDHAYTGGCTTSNGANVLLTHDEPGAPHLNPAPDSTWGLHLFDANIALGNLTDMVRKETKAYFR